MAELNLAQGIDLLDRRTRTVRIALFTYIAISSAEMLAALAEASGWVDTKAEELSPLSMVAASAAALYAVALIATMVLVALWIYRAHANLRQADLAGLEFTPGWAVGWYFIPFACLFKPFQAMRELWNVSLLQSDGFGQEADARLKTWWGAWIVGNILNNVGLRLQSMSGDEGRMIGYSVDAISTATMIVASWFLLQIIETINTAQRNGMTMAATFA